MQIEIINTGTELLLGNVINTHLAYLGQKLFPLGLRISRQVTVPDGPLIRDALLEAFDRCDILIVTGGLGPTSDDVTRDVTAELLGLKLNVQQDILDRIAARLKRRNIILRPGMQRQAQVPDGAVVLYNDNGTAPGVYLRPQDTPSSRTPHLFLLPGPPRELEPMFENYAMPILMDICEGLERKECRIFRVIGIGESAVEEMIGRRLSEIPELEVGYCARPNEVDLRLIGSAELLEKVTSEVLTILGRNIASHKGERLEFLTVQRLIELKKKIATAESCTGGFLAHRITNVPGASEIFQEGFVTYSNEAKTALLGVPAELVRQHGAVSAEVATAMADGALEKSGADFAISITGIAGPGGGTPEKPAGTVFIGLASRDGETEVRREFFPTDRETFKQIVTQTALDMLRLQIYPASAA